MKKIICLVYFALFSIASLAQNSGKLEFLGIPIDGSPKRFATRLKNKGFTEYGILDGYYGQFNGRAVDVYIHTNKNKVDRVYVSFPYESEDDVRFSYNRLLSQFQASPKYVEATINPEIEDEDDISYEIKTNKERFESSFCFFNPDRTPAEISTQLYNTVTRLLPNDGDKRVCEVISYYLELAKEERNEFYSMLLREIVKYVNVDDRERIYLIMESYFAAMKEIADGLVWFMIHADDDKYKIGLYYDNPHNQAHGEDL